MGLPRAIAGYDVLGELGRGGMGVVLRVRHRATGAARALKLLDAAPDPEGIARFRREAEALARAGGTGVVPVHESGLEQGRFFYVMGLFEGGSLRALLRARGHLPWRQALALVAQVARALERCHERGLVHRDLKPENVLLDEQGAPWIADFGCARDLAGGRLTATGELLGTIAYMPPEQLEGRPVDARADVFALGVVLHELVVGSRPFEGRSPVQQLLAIRESPRTAPARNAGAPPALDEVLSRALAPDAGTRTPSAGALASELEAILAGESVSAPAPRSKARAPLPTARIASLPGLAIVLAVGAAVALRPAGPDPAPGPSPRAQVSSRAAEAADAAVEQALQAIRKDHAHVPWPTLAPQLRAHGDAGRAAIDREVARGSLEARELRVRLARPPQGALASDVAALASAASVPVLGSLADFLLGVGFQGGGVEAARALVARADMPSFAALLATELLVLDTDPARLEAADLIRGPAGTDPAALALADTWGEAEDFAGAFSHFVLGTRTGPPPPTKRLEESIRRLQHRGLARALPSLLRPFVAAARIVAEELPSLEDATPDELAAAAAPVRAIAATLKGEVKVAGLAELTQLHEVLDESTRQDADSLDAAIAATPGLAEREPRLAAVLLRGAARRRVRRGPVAGRLELLERLEPTAKTLLARLEDRMDAGTEDERLRTREALFKLGRDFGRLYEMHRNAVVADEARVAPRESEIHLRGIAALLGIGIDRGRLHTDLGGEAYLLKLLGRPFASRIATDLGIAFGKSEEGQGRKPARADLEKAADAASSPADRRDAYLALALVELDEADFPAARAWLAKARATGSDAAPIFPRLDAERVEALIRAAEAHRERD